MKIFVNILRHKNKIPTQKHSAIICAMKIKVGGDETFVDFSAIKLARGPVGHTLT